MLTMSRPRKKQTSVKNLLHPTEGNRSTSDTSWLSLKSVSQSICIHRMVY